MDWAAADAVAAEHGESFFIFDEAKFRANFTNLRAAFDAHYPHTRIGYSYKTNYTPYLCRIVHALGGYAEVVSEMEYELARRLGIEGPRIIFNGPYKSGVGFRDAALRGARINLDSTRDTELLIDVARDNPGKIFDVVIRCNFPLAADAVSRFGMDVEGAAFRTTLTAIDHAANIRLAGLHCHFPDRDLDSFGRRARKMVALTRQIFPDAPPDLLNIGGGYFSDMPEALRQSFGVPPARFEDYGALVGGILQDAFGGTGTPPALFLEPGTAIVADTFRFYTRVVGTKTVRGRHFATVAGSIFDISPTARSRNLPAQALCQGGGASQDEPYDIVGFTCIEGDILTEGLAAPLATGDFITFGNVGSYSVVMRPPFILPANPILVAQDDGIKVIKNRETGSDVFRNFVF